MSTNYFSKLSAEELAGRDEATKKVDEQRKAICDKIIQEYKSGLRKSKKKR